MVLAIISVVLAALVPSFLSIRVAEQARATNKNLETVMNAAAAFTQSNGCLPCPTPQNKASTNGRGVVRGDTTSNPAACGTCATAVGLVPFRSLGVPESNARDGYGNWLTYAVDATLTNPVTVVTPPTAPCRSGDSNPPCSATDITNSARKKGLCQAGLSTTNRVTVTLFNGTTQSVAILVLSHGANGYGAYQYKDPTVLLAFPPAHVSCGPGEKGAERCNAENNIARFYQAQPGNNDTDPFDDQMLFYSRNAFVALPGGLTCQNGETY